MLLKAAAYGCDGCGRKLTEGELAAAGQGVAAAQQAFNAAGLYFRADENLFCSACLPHAPAWYDRLAELTRKALDFAKPRRKFIAAERRKHEGGGPRPVDLPKAEAAGS